LVVTGSYYDFTFYTYLRMFFHASAYAVFQSENTKLLKEWLTGVHQSTNETIQERRVNLALEVLPI